MIKRTQRTELYDVWNRFANGGDIDAVPPNIRKSWQRCRQANLNPRKELSFIGMDQASLRKHIDGRLDLYHLLHAHNSNIEKYFDFSPMAVFFSDSDGTILSATGDDKILRLIKRNLQTEMVGGNIKEDVIGTTAPGICLEEKRFAAVHAEEHYFREIHWASCIATPVFDWEQNILGCLNFTVTANDAEKLRHLIPVLLNTANCIQFEMSLKSRLEQLDLFHSYYRSTFDYSMSMLILVGRQGQVIDLNRTAREALKITPGEAKSKDIGTLFGDRSKLASVLRPSGGKILLYGRNSEWFSVESIPLSDQNGMDVAFLLKMEKEKNPQRISGKSEGSARYTFENIIGEHVAITNVIEKAKMAARTCSNILIEGETGTGKELFAHAIHTKSRYHRGPFIAVNCSAFPRELVESELFGYEKGAYTGALRGGSPGKFEMGDTGTIFLDEVHTMDMATQTKILRVIEDRHVTRIGGKYAIPLDLRIIAASSEKLDERMAGGYFLAPLFYRLNVVKLSIPNLRQRPEDIPVLVDHFIEEMNRTFHRSIRNVDPDTLATMVRYGWPGNVRELRNCIERAFNFCTGDTIMINDVLDSIPAISKAESASGETMKDVTRKLMIEALARFGNVKDAARSLNIPLTTFYRKMKKFGIPQTSR